MNQLTSNRRDVALSQSIHQLRYVFTSLALSLLLYAVVQYLCWLPQQSKTVLISGRWVDHRASIGLLPLPSLVPVLIKPFDSQR